MFNLRSRRKSESDSEKFSSTVQFKGPEGCIRSETGFGFCKVGQSHVDKITFVGWSTMFRWFGVAVETGFNEKIICDRFLGLYSKPAMRNRGRMKTFILYFSQQVGKHLNWPFRASLSFPFRFRFLLGHFWSTLRIRNRLGRTLKLLRAADFFFTHILPPAHFQRSRFIKKLRCWRVRGICSGSWKRRPLPNMVIHLHAF